MSKDLSIVVLGLVIAALPFLGFPGRWETVILVVAGISISILALLLRQHMLRSGYPTARPAPDVYVENGVRPEAGAHPVNAVHGEEAKK